MASFEIKWGTNRYSIDLSQQEYDTATVADLKLKCQSLTKVEPHFQKLLSHGAILKDEQKLIKEYKIQTGSKIMMMGSTKHYLDKEPKEDAPVATRLQWIKNRRDSVIRPDIERYKTQVQEYQHHNTKQTKKLIVYGDYLHEQLMHIIAQLDTMPHVNEQERNERKQSVKDTQCLLDQLEQIKCDLTRLLE